MDIKCPSCGRNIHFAKDTDVTDSPFCPSCGGRLLPEDKTEMYNVIRSEMEASRKDRKSLRHGKKVIIAGIATLVVIAAILIFVLTGGKNYQVGEKVTFGSYAGEPIEWEILDKNNDGTYLMVSTKGLETKRYNDTSEAVTWETCTLRQWLNGEFYDTAFTDSEKVRIRTTDVRNEDNIEYGTVGGNDTQDKVFLLSLSELEKYYNPHDNVNDAGDKGGQNLICIATEHAISTGAGVLGEKYVEEYQQGFDYPLQADGGYWWLRSPGAESDSAAFVFTVGWIAPQGFDVFNVAILVRPVVTARLS